MVMVRGICSGFSGLPALVEHSIGQLLESASPRVEPIPFEIAVELGVTVVEQEPALWRDDFEHLRRFLRLDLLLGGSPKCTPDLLHDRPHGSSVHPATDAKNDEPVTSGWSRRRRCRGRAVLYARIYDDRGRVDLVLVFFMADCRGD